MDDYIAERLTKSTAARKDVQGAPNQRVRLTSGVEDSRSREAVVAEDVGSPRFESERIAGTQAPPVEPIIGKRRGRPQTITDMKAYKAQKAKEYRLKAKREHK